MGRVASSDDQVDITRMLLSCMAGGEYNRTPERLVE